MKSKKNQFKINNIDNLKELERYIILKSVLHTKRELEKSYYPVASGKNKKRTKGKKEFVERLRSLKMLSIVNYVRLFGHFLLWAIKLLLPDFLVSHPSLWDNFKTLRKDPSFRPLRMAFFAWIVFSSTFILLLIYSLINAPKIFAVSNYQITVDTVDGQGNHLSGGEVFVENITDWVSSPYSFDSSKTTRMYYGRWGDLSLEVIKNFQVIKNKTYHINALTGDMVEESTVGLTQVLFEYNPATITADTIDIASYDHVDGQVKIDGATWVDTPYTFSANNSISNTYYGKFLDLEASTTIAAEIANVYRVNAETGDTDISSSADDSIKIEFMFEQIVEPITQIATITVDTIDVTSHEHIDGQVQIDGIATWVDAPYTFSIDKGTSKNYYGKFSELQASSTISADIASVYRINTVTGITTISSSTDDSTKIEFMFGQFIISGIATSINTSSIDIGWETSINASSQVLYGLTNECSEYTSELDTPDGVIAHIVSVSDLNPCTTYYFKVKSRDESLGDAYGPVFVFNTLGCVGNAEVNLTNENTVSPETGGSVTLLGSDNSEITINAPANFSASSSVFKIQKMNETQILSATGNPQEYEPVGNFSSLQAFSLYGEEITSFASPIAVTMNYSISDIVGINEQSLKIFRWSGGAWNELSNCNVNIGERKVTCETHGFSIFGLFGQEEEEEAEEEEDEEEEEEEEVAPTPAASSGGGLPLDAYNLPSPPASISINNGDESTDSRIVNLALEAGYNIERMVISNQADLGSDGQEKYQESKKEWDICSKAGGVLKSPTCPDGVYKVYVKFYTRWGQASEIVYDEIVYRQAEATQTSKAITEKELSFPEENAKKTSTSIKSFEPRVVVVKDSIAQVVAPINLEELKEEVFKKQVLSSLPDVLNPKLVIQSVKSKIDELDNDLSYEKLQQISQELSSLSLLKGEDVKKELYSVLEINKEDEVYLRNKYLDLKSSVELNNVLLDSGGQNALYSIWYNFGSLVMKMAIVNLTDKKANIPFLAYLPQEVKPEHIGSTGGFKFEYDKSAETYMLSGVFDLEAGEAIVRKVSIKDAWTIDKNRVRNLKSRLNELYELGKQNKLNNKILSFKDDIDPQLDILLLKKSDINLAPQDRIFEFREDEQKIEEIERYLGQIAVLVAEPKISTRIYKAFGGTENVQILLLLGVIIVSGFGLFFVIIFKIWKNQIMIMANEAVLKSRLHIPSNHYESFEKRIIIRIIIISAIMIIAMSVYLAWRFGLFVKTGF